MSLTLILMVTAAAAASMGYLAARKKGEEEPRDDDHDDEPGARKSGERKREDDKIDEKKSGSGARGNGPAKKPKPAASPFEGMPLALGDVVLADGGERWLAGAIVAREGDRVLGALFLAPEGTVHKAVAAFAPPRTDVYWMSPAELASPDEPPATIELDGIALRRKGRLPVSFERLGQGAPNVGEDGLWAVYEGGGREVAIVVASGGKTYAFSGLRFDEGEYDRLGGGGD